MSTPTKRIDVIRLLRAARQSEPLQHALMVSEGTLLTLAQLSRLTWGHVDIKKSRIWAVGKTGNTARILPLTEYAHASLVTWRSKHRAAKKEDRVFPANLGRQFSAVCRSSQRLNGMTFRKFREHNISRLIEKGKPK